ncbi:MAG: crosslink repair DNA glycosylase YcaQ family protein, partial [Acidimicrobiia bacterium]
MRRVDTTERRSRLALRHRLAAPARDPIEATRSVVALHSSDPATVFLSVRARVTGFRIEDLEEALYEDRSLVRFYGMRRTLWVIEREMVPVVHNSSTRAVGEKDRKRSIKILEDAGITDDGAAWLSEIEPKTLATIAEHGQILARDLTKTIPELQGKIEYRNKAGKLMGTSGLTTRVLNQLALESRVVRGRPAGSWISGQYRWAETDDWLGGSIEVRSVAEASAELVRTWLYAYGPATETDLRWWTGWPVRQVRKALSDAGAVEVALEDGEGYLLTEDLAPIEAPEP